MTLSDFFEDSDQFLNHACLDPPLPRVVQIELTADCNLRCVFCPLQSEPRERHGRDRRLTLLDLQTKFYSLLRQAYEVELTGFGEIFCHPHLIEVLRLFKQLRLTVNATSNGTLWTPPLLETIVREGLIDLMCVSLDAGTADTYAALRVGGNFPTVLANIQTLREIKDTYGRAKPIVHLSFISTRRNIRELPTVVRLAKQLGANGVVVQGLNENRPPAAQTAGGVSEEVEIFREAADIAAESGVNLEFWYQSRTVVEPGPHVRSLPDAAPAPDGRPIVRDCPHPWERLFIKSNLDVQACATLWERLIMGNMRQQPVEEIWRGDNYRELRRQLACTRAPVECLTCTTKPAKMPRTVEEMADEVLFGQKVSYQLGQGFYDAEHDHHGRPFRWTSGDATFFLKNTQRPFLDIELTVHPRFKPIKVALIVNDLVIDRFTTDDLGSGMLRFALPPFDDPVLQVSFVLDRHSTPAEVGDGDSRRPLGLVLYRAALAGVSQLLEPRVQVGRNDEKHLGRGFFPREAGMVEPVRWTGERASFVIRGGGEDLAIALPVAPPLIGRAVTVLEAGEPVANFTLPAEPGPFQARLTLPERRPWHAITLLCPELWVPGGDDTRRLGVMFAGARLRRPGWWKIR